MQHGNQDAQGRLAALSQPDPNSLSRQQHELLAETTLVRKRTQAKQRSDASGQRPAGRPDEKKIMENVRKGSMLIPSAPGNDYSPTMPSAPSMPSMPSILQQQPQQQQQQPPEQQPKPQKQQSLASMPRPVSQSLPQSPYPPGQRPLPGGSKQFGNATRYTLTDPGPRSGSVQGPSGTGPVPSNKAGSPEPGRRPTPQQNRPSVQQPGQPDLEQVSPPKPIQSHSPQPIISTLPPPGTGFDQGPHTQRPYKGAQTFQEMGIATAKVEDKECVIM